MKKIIYTNERGTVSIVHLAPQAMLEDETEDEFIARVMAKDVPPGSDAAVIDESVIPTDRTFRDAWVHGGDKVGVDMTKAVEIHQNKLRELRAPILAGLDVYFMRALEAGDTKSQADILAKKQALRDVTKDPALAAAKTPAELSAVMPAILEPQ